MTPTRVPPPGLIDHRPRDLLVLAGEWAADAEAPRGYMMRRYGGWPELGARMRTAVPSTVVLVRVEDEDALARMEEMIRATPSVPVVAAMGLRGADADGVRRVIDAGAAEVADLDGARTTQALAPILRRAHARPLKRRIGPRLPVWMREEARTLVRAAAETVADHGGRTVLAGIFGLYPRTVAGKCRDLDLPAPRRLLGWARVLMALALREEEARSVRNVAASAGYRDASSLTRAIANFAATPHADFDAAMTHLVDELRAYRHADRPRRAA